MQRGLLAQQHVVGADGALRARLGLRTLQGQGVRGDIGADLSGRGLRQRPLKVQLCLLHHRLLPLQGNLRITDDSTFIKTCHDELELIRKKEISLHENIIKNSLSLYTAARLCVCAQAEIELILLTV